MGVLAGVIAAAAFGRARILQNPDRWLSSDLGLKASTFPALSALSSGSHRVTLVLPDGRRVPRVFLIHDRIIAREGQRYRLSFDPASAVDIVDEVRS